MAVLVEVTRGERVESWHAGAIAIVESTGKVVSSIGDIESPIFPRSAIKALQALPLVESGAADTYDLSSKALSIACASHNGEAAHVTVVKEMLAACHLTEDALECGAQSPKYEVDQAILHRAGKEPTPAHNNCSGKHAGFLCFSQKAGFGHRGYVKAHHPVQREVRNVVASMADFSLEGERGEVLCGIDGCSIPTYAMPLKHLALAFARFGTGQDLPAARARAAERLRQAVAQDPYMVAGHDRFCTDVMDIFGARAFVKTGAEGVFCASLPQQGLGVALKCWDGATRASEVMMAAILDAFLPMSEGEAVALDTWRKNKLINRNAIHVGNVQLVEGVLAHLIQKKSD